MQCRREWSAPTQPRSNTVSCTVGTPAATLALALLLLLRTHMCIYIYIYMYREREIDR